MNSRNKGKAGEREAAAELGSLLGVAARRGVQYQGGPDSPDVVLDGVAIHVEAKRTERLLLWAAIEIDEAVSGATQRECVEVALGLLGKMIELRRREVAAK